MLVSHSTLKDQFNEFDVSGFRTHEQKDPKNETLNVQLSCKTLLVKASDGTLRHLFTRSGVTLSSPIASL